MLPTKARSARSEMAILHSPFALTGVLHASGGPLLPSLVARLHFNDAQSGLLFFLYFVGTSMGALVCVRSFARLTWMGFFLAGASALGIAFAGPLLVWPLFFLFGIGVGIPMTSISMIAGRRFGERSAAPLTFLNFSWSAGALAAPLLAGRLLVHHAYPAAYVVLAAASACAGVACLLFVRDDAASAACQPASGHERVLRWILLIALLTSLEVGIDNISVTWLATYALRTSFSGAAHAATASSLYWIGNFASRGLSALLLLRARPLRVLTSVVLLALFGCGLLLADPTILVRDLGMLALGAAIAPIFPLLLSQFFAHVSNASHARWVLACCGFGGSVLPWMTGFISARTGSLRLGLLVVPAALLLILFALPALRSSGTAAEA